MTFILKFARIILIEVKCIYRCTWRFRLRSYLDDFNALVVDQKVLDRAQALDDLNNEMAGREVGRISKFLPRSGESGLVGGKRGQSAGIGLSALDIMLATSPDYLALHADLANDLRNAQDQNHALDERLDAAIDAAQRNADGIMDQAVLLPTGERAFLDEDDVAWTTDDRRVDPAIAAGIDWADRPTRSAYTESRDALSALEDAQDENRRLGVRLGDIDNTIHDEDNPATMDEMPKLHEEVEAIERQMDRIDQSLHRLDGQEPAEPDALAITADAVPQL